MHWNAFEYICFICVLELFRTHFVYCVFILQSANVGSCFEVCSWLSFKQLSAFIIDFFLGNLLLIARNILIFSEFPNRKGSPLRQTLCDESCHMQEYSATFCIFLWLCRYSLIFLSRIYFEDLIHWGNMLPQIVLQC